MKLHNVLILGLLFAPVVFAQVADPGVKTAPAAEAAVAACGGDDIYCGLRRQADAARAKWQQLDTATDKQLQVLAAKDVCSPRISALIDAAEASMETYMTLEREYAKVWTKDSHEKINMARNIVASQATMVDELAKLKAAEEADLMETERRRDELKKLGDGAADVVKEADELVDQMNQTKAKLDKTISEMSEVGNRATASRELVNIRESKVKEYSAQLDTELIALKAVYLKKKEAYGTRCYSKGVTLPTLPKIDFGTPNPVPNKVPPQ